MSYLSIVNNGKRCWSKESCSSIHEILTEYEDKKSITPKVLVYWKLHTFLTKALTEVGFVWASHPKSAEKALWVLHTKKWTPTVQIEYTHRQGIVLRVNDKVRLLRDMFPLWGILREDFKRTNS